MNIYDEVLKALSQSLIDEHLDLFKKYATKITEASKSQDAEALLNIIKQIEQESGLNLQDAKQLLTANLSLEIQYSNETQNNKMEIAIAQLRRKAVEILSKQNIDNVVSTISIDVTLRWDDLKRISKSVYKDIGKKIFIVPCSERISGQILALMFPYKLCFTLANMYADESNETIIMNFIDDPLIRKKSIEKIDEFNIEVYAYYFKSDDDKEYVLISTKKLPQTFAEVYGVSFSLKEYKSVGESAKLPSKTPLFFVSQVKDLLSPISNEEYLQLCKKWTFDDLRKILRGELELPAWYEKLILAWLFSGDWQGYPLHLFICGPGGTLKSAFADALSTVLHEKVVSGTSTTLTGLIPSFKSSPPSPGSLVLSKRVAIVDEFFKMLARVSRRTGSEIIELATLNELLDHKRRSYISGNGALHDLKMSAKALFITNPITKHESIAEVFESIEDTFISRFLTVWHDRQFVEYTSKLKDIYRKLPDRPNFEFIRLCDYMNRFTVKIDVNKVREIFNEVKTHVITSALEQYNMRYLHHIHLLIDGLAKLNAFIRKEVPNEAKEEDYEEAKELMMRIVMSWKDINIDAVPVRQRKYYLDYQQSLVYEFIEKFRGVDLKDLTDAFNIENLDEILQHLEKYSLIKQKDGKYYPYWYTFKESDVNDLAEKYNFEEIKKESEIEGKEGKKHIIPDYAVKCFLEKYEAVEEIVLIEFLRYCGFKKPEELIAYYISQHIIFRDNEGKLRLV